MESNEASGFREETRGSVAVIGLGYVGLPLALLFVRKGFAVAGIDADAHKIDAVARGVSYLPDIADAKLAEALETGRFAPTGHFEAIANSDSIIICVPTPLTPCHTPDLTCLQNAAKEIGRFLRHGHLAVLESSTYPGTTREVLAPVLESLSGLKAGKDFHVGYSPERIDPGNRQYRMEQIPKVVSGLTPSCAEAVCALYAQVFDRTVPVSSPEAAEMTKLVENAQRLVNISFMNELAIICDEMQIDIWEVIESAGTKPFGFAPYYPGPGIGGHCIPVDPLYLQWKAQTFGKLSKFIQLSDEVNQTLPSYIADRISSLLRFKTDPKVVLYGVAYKKDVNDARESPAFELIRLLEKKGMKVTYHDPLIPLILLDGRRLESVPLTDETLKYNDCVIIMTDHTGMPLGRIIEEASLVFDTRNATAGIGKRRNVVRLGAGNRDSRRGFQIV